MTKRKKSKPRKVKPIFYSYCFPELQKIARKMGYNLLLHGSMDRDFDLVCVPWVDKPKSHIKVLLAFCKYLGAPVYTNTRNEYDFGFSMLGGGRSAYIINLNRASEWNNYKDDEYYLDISFTPLPTK